MKLLAVLCALVAVAAAKKFHPDASFSVSSSIKHYAGNYRPGQKVDCYAKLDDAQVASASREVTENDARGYVHIALYPLNGLVKFQAKISHPEKFPGELRTLKLYRGVRGVEDDGLNGVLDNGNGELIDFEELVGGEIVRDKIGQFWLADEADAQRLLNNAVFAAVTVQQQAVDGLTVAIRGQVICQAQDHAEISSSLESVDM